MTTGYVYFIECRDRDKKPVAIKIGYSENPARRLTKISSDSLYDCELLGVIAGSRKEEKQIQSIFQNDVIRREWFQVSDRLHQYISDKTFLPEPVKRRIARMNPENPTEDFRSLIWSWPTLADFADCIGVSVATAAQMRSRNLVSARYFQKIVVGAKQQNIPGVDLSVLVQMRNSTVSNTLLRTLRSKASQTAGQ